jgi:hypothetical protein
MFSVCFDGRCSVDSSEYTKYFNSSELSTPLLAKAQPSNQHARLSTDQTAAPTKKIQRLETSLEQAEASSFKDKSLGLLKTTVSVALLAGGIFGFIALSGALALAVFAGGLMTFLALNHSYERALAKELGQKEATGSAVTGFTAPIRQAFYRVDRLNKSLANAKTEQFLVLSDERLTRPDSTSSNGGI